MTEQLSPFAQALSTLLERYDEHADGNIKEFLQEQMRASGAYATNAESDDTLEKISSTIDSISQGFQEIQDYRKKGRSVGIWLRDKLGEITASMSAEGKKDVINAVKNGLATANQELAEQLTGGAVSGPLLPELPSQDFSGPNQTGIAENLRQELSANSVLELMGLGTLPASGSVSSDPLVRSPFRTIPVVQKYFEQALNTKSDDNLKKVVSTGVEIARNLDMLPKTMKEHLPEEITTIVDRGMSMAKLAYQTGTGEIQPETAINHAVDRAAAAAKTMTSVACARIGGQMGEKAGAAIGRTLGFVFGPLGSGMAGTIGAAVGRMAGTAVGRFIGTGIEKVASAAKKVGAFICEKVRDVAESVTDWVSDKWDAFTSWLGW